MNVVRNSDKPHFCPRPAESSLELPSGVRYSIRPALEADAREVTKVIHDAFEVWKEIGLTLGPMLQTIEQTKKHLKGKGVIAQDSRGVIVGTFSLDEGAVALRGDGLIDFIEGEDAFVFIATDTALKTPGGKLLVFKKAAVVRDKAHHGLGTHLYALAEKLARDNGYSGMILETVKEAGWLYDWYIRLGFRPIGKYCYPGRVDTILMIKLFTGPL